MLSQLLIVDSNKEICKQMSWALAQHFEVFTAYDRPSALALCKRIRPAVITLDLALPPQLDGMAEGFRTLRELLQANACAKVIVITSCEERAYALEAIGQGAYDFFRKPLQLHELQICLIRALHVYQLEREYRALQLHRLPDTFADLVGKCRAMHDLYGAIRRVAVTKVPVLIRGESGTGKELVARAIHQLSPWANGPFVAINCAAIPEQLFESELFGYEKGAFTGAHTQRKGRVELAEGGTLFLDEIGDVPPSLQVKLLRFLQEHTVEHLGSGKTLHVDTRVLAATHTNLEEAIEQGRFREDLYYRISVVRLALPPLRNRGEDIILLATTLLRRYNAEFQKRIVGFEEQALSAMYTHRWPGNVRELESRIKRAVIMAEGPLLTPADLELTATPVHTEFRTLREAREETEKALIRKVLARHQGNVSRTAADLAISRPTLHELLAKYAIERPS